MRPLNDRTYRGGPVVYWMNRDRRTRDNWALLAAQEFAQQHKEPLGVVFVFSQKKTIPWRELSFSVEGLREVETALRLKGIPFFLLDAGDPVNRILSFFRKHRVGACLTDFSPILDDVKDAERLARKASIPVHQADAHNIVPCWLASDHREMTARTFGKKIEKFLPDFLSDIPRLKKHIITWPESVKKTDWRTFDRHLRVDRSVKPTDEMCSGETAAMAAWRALMKNRLKGHADIAPYVRFGQLSAQRIALEAKGAGVSSANIKTFWDQAVVRRELADNFCFYS